MIGSMYYTASRVCKSVLLFFARRRAADLRAAAEKRDAKIEDLYIQRGKEEERAADCRRMAQSYEKRADQCLVTAIEEWRKHEAQCAREQQEIERLSAEVRRAL